MQEIRQAYFSGERALFHSKHLAVFDSVFDDGESPLKESEDIALYGCLLRWKYPLWYCKQVKAERCTWFEMARAGVWYSRDIDIRHAVIQAPKNFRRCQNLTLTDVQLTHAQETLWHCENVVLDHVSAIGDYFAMNCRHVQASHFTLDGNYGFDGACDVTIRDATMLTKDAFWNTERVTVYDSYISGEYLGWNSKHLKLVRCTVESLQGLCYIEDLVLDHCKLVHTTYAFEYSTQIQATVEGRIDSVLNPASGQITADEIQDLIVEIDHVDPDATTIHCTRIQRTLSHPNWE